MALTIESIQFHSVKQPLKQPFITVLQQVNEREVTVVSLRSNDGIEGYGECVAFDTPWYTEETVTGSRFVMEKVIAPLLTGRQLNNPYEADRLLSKIKGNHMAKAALEMAVWDLFAKHADVPLYSYIGGIDEPIPAGVVVAADSGNLAAGVEAAVQKGYRRIKIKISPASDAEKLRAIVASYPSIVFYADANGSFSGKPLEQLAAFDSIRFSLIEQPYGEQEWECHRNARRAMQTPICLDESITSLEDVKRMTLEQAGDTIVLKPGRLGGWAETLRIVDYCRQNHVEMWVGGMIEFGVSKAHNLALSSLPAVRLTGDFSDSSHFWEQDITEPKIRVAKGHITLSSQPGIGYRVLL